MEQGGEGGARERERAEEAAYMSVYVGGGNLLGLPIMGKEGEQR